MRKLRLKELAMLRLLSHSKAKPRLKLSFEP